MEFTSELLIVFLAAFGPAPRFGPARFDGARFPDLKFSEAEFSEDCSFAGAIFRGSATFSCTFAGNVWFGPSPEFHSAATFAQPARFDGVQFNGDAHFGGVRELGMWTASTHAVRSQRARGARQVSPGVTFNGGVSFAQCKFDGTTAGWQSVEFGNYARFDQAEFTASAQFSESKFNSDASFEEAHFYEYAGFAGATFGRDANFTDTEFQARADFRDVTFSAPEGSQLGPFTAHELDLSGVRSTAALTVQCGGLTQITAAKLQCASGLNLQLDGTVKIDASAIRSARELTLTCHDGDLTLVDAAFDTPSTISSVPANPAPRLLALEKVDATNLTLAGLRLDACRFQGCYNRDKLRIEGPLRFAGTPDDGLWTNRNVVAEEHAWRAEFDQRPHGWFPKSCRRPDETSPMRLGLLRSGWSTREEAAQVQSIYRDLRKGREDAKDEPGASDFYFGEMEMRRLAATPRSWERVLLTAYWAVSGYGLRASRALATLVLVLALGTLGFATIGFGPSTQTAYLPVTSTQPVSYRQVSQTGPKPGWAAAVDQSVDSATALLRQNTPRPLTTPGRVIEILLRLLGPLLIGLAVLALRNRVKR